METERELLKLIGGFRRTKKQFFGIIFRRSKTEIQKG